MELRIHPCAFRKHNQPPHPVRSYNYFFFVQVFINAQNLLWLNVEQSSRLDVCACKHVWM